MQECMRRIGHTGILNTGIATVMEIFSLQFLRVIIHSVSMLHSKKQNETMKSHKNFRAIYPGRDEDFYGEFHLTNRK
jgi:hypothetical protein